MVVTFSPGILNGRVSKTRSCLGIARVVWLPFDESSRPLNRKNRISSNATHDRLTFVVKARRARRCCSMMSCAWVLGGVDEDGAEAVTVAIGVKHGSGL